jgi:flavorubredoxin
MNQKHNKEFLSEVKNYYDAIFSPFIKDVKYGLNKLKEIDIDFACVSHGPILTKGCKLEKIVSLYDE